MVSKKNSSSDFLPPGWKIQIKKNNGRKIKCYINSKTRQKFYSKIAVFRHIKDESVSNGEIQPSNENSKKSSGKMQMQLVEANDLQWLPTGWVLERRIRKSGAKAGTQYKCYIDPSTGSTFYSKPEVLRYLRSKQCHPGSSRQKDRRGNGHSPSKGSDDSSSVHKISPEPKSPFAGELKVVIERTLDQDLPSGWVKESRIKVLNNKTVRRDLFYYDPDPASRLVFRSKLEALRYLETGEISRHAYRRRKGSIIGEDVAIGKTPTTSSGEREEISKTSTRKQLCAGESSTGQSILAIPEAGGDEKAVGKKSKRSSSRVKQAHSGSSSPKQSILSPESVSNSQDDVAKPLLEKVSGTRKTMGKTKHTAPEVLDAVANYATFNNDNKPSPAHSRGMLSEENPVDAAIQGCSNGKAQASKRKTQDGMLPSVPSRSSKRLAGVEAHIMFHPIAIEHAHRATNRKLSCTKSTPSVELIPSLELGSKDGKLPSVPSRSSKRLAGVDAQITFHPIAMEHAHRATNRKSSCTKPIPSLELIPHLESGSKDGKVPSRSSKRLAGIDAQITYHPIPTEHSHLAANKKTSRIKPIPSLELVPSKLQEKHETVHMQDWNEHVCQAPRVPCLVSAPNESQVKCWNDGMQDVLVSQNEKHCTPDVNTDIFPASQGSPSNKINDVTSHVEKCHTLFDTDNVDRSQGEPSNKFDNLSEEEKHSVLEINTVSVLAAQEEPSNKLVDLTSPKDKHCTLYVDREVVLETQGEPVSVLATQEEPSNKLGDLASPEDKSCILYVDREAVLAKQGEPVSVLATQEPSDKLGDLTSPEDKHCALYVDREAVLPTQGEPLNKIDHVTPKNSLLVDLNFLQLEEAPPGFSGDAAVNVSSTTLKPSLEHPMDTVHGNKVESTSKAQPVIGEQLGAIQRETMQPSSELCFSSPLWSDPCLEFAFKTLTGSIPFDDNLAIQDYIQHQLRTSEEGCNNQSLPDIRAPSILRNDETKMVSPLPEEVKFPNSNGFGSHEIKQVKNQ